MQYDIKHTCEAWTPTVVNLDHVRHDRRFTRVSQTHKFDAPLAFGATPAAWAGISVSIA